MKFGRLEKASQQAGAPVRRSRYAYLALVREIASFPKTDSKGVVLSGDIVMRLGTGMIPVYLTSASQEFSYETVGDADSQIFKVKFIGTHPGTAQEALEFARNMRNEEFIVVIPECGSETYKVLGLPCAPLVMKSSHAANKEGEKFTFTLEQEIGSENVYMLYGGVNEITEAGTHPGGGTTTPTDPQAPNTGGVFADPNKYYTKEEVNDLISQAYGGPGAGYYTMADIDAKLELMRDFFAEQLRLKQDK